jgi:hypothetical protein
MKITGLTYSLSDLTEEELHEGQAYGILRKLIRSQIMTDHHSDRPDIEHHLGLMITFGPLIFLVVFLLLETEVASESLSKAMASFTVSQYFTCLQVYTLHT